MSPGRNKSEKKVVIGSMTFTDIFLQTKEITQ